MKHYVATYAWQANRPDYFKAFEAFSIEEVCQLWRMWCDRQPYGHEMRLLWVTELDWHIKERTRPQFIVYSTVWTEGMVVAHSLDKAFAIGWDGARGGVAYVDGLDKLLKTHTYQLFEVLDDETRAQVYDTSFYSRRK